MNGSEKRILRLGPSSELITTGEMENAAVAVALMYAAYRVRFLSDTQGPQQQQQRPPFHRWYSSVFPSLNMAVKRREQALQEYKRLQLKVEKHEEKERTGQVIAKLHQAREELRPIREDFEVKNRQLLDEMPKFYNSRIDFFKPSFQSLIRAQVVYYTEMSRVFGELALQVDEVPLSDADREKENEAKLAELRALSIVADD
ncbi:unnamed protein product [Ranitomeya imitator]|uniref:BAR domain-containing protein n=1 Tax=Ranitomeya imitator TaxID=111125 RepID=A0ABN9M237_9NEOB|nr:unnamed protein product [Ranitomeya imitator]